MPVTAELPVSLPRAIFHGKNSVGAFTYFNGAAEVFQTRIGRYCSIAQDVMIGPGEHPVGNLSTHPFAFGGGRNRFQNQAGYGELLQSTKSNVVHLTTKIGSDVWVGTRCFIAQGVEIGHGCVIGAGAIVTKNLAPYSIAVGAPAKVIRPRFPEVIVERLLKLKWWNYWLNKHVIGELNYGDIEACLDRLEGLIADNKIQRANFKTRTLRGKPLQRKIHTLLPWS